MYQQIASNVRRSWLLMFFFALLIGLIAYAFAQINGMGYSGVVLAVVIAVGLTWVSYYYSDRMVLSISRAKPLAKEDNPYLYNIVEALAIGAGVPAPKVYVIDDTAPNAFATGRDPQHAVICVTSGLLQKMDRLELEGVIAHEMSHIRNRDILLMTIAVTMAGVVTLLADWMVRYTWRSGRSRRRNDREGGGGAEAIILLVGLVLAILAPFFAMLIQLAISRQREYLADSSAALLTRYPKGLADALRKIAADPEPLEVANKATAHLYIYNPLKDNEGHMDRLFDTHPPVADRIKRLEAMAL
ncbi:MAG: zinc metalloprotease HtpX [Bacillota bacterium]